MSSSPLVSLVKSCRQFPLNTAQQMLMKLIMSHCCTFAEIVEVYSVSWHETSLPFGVMFAGFLLKHGVWTTRHHLFAPNESSCHRFYNEPFDCVVSQPLVHSGLKQQHHQGKQKALWGLINILDKNKALLFKGALTGLLFVICIQINCV